MSSKRAPLSQALRRESELFEQSKDHTKPAGAYKRTKPASDPSQVYSIRIPVSRLGELRRLADASGLQPSSMIRAWVLERLESENRGPADLTKMAEEVVAAASRLRAASRRRPSLEEG